MRNWALFWLAAFIVVFFLICYAQAAGFRAWVNRVYARVAPDFGAFAKSAWGAVVGVARKRAAPAAPVIRDSRITEFSSDGAKLPITEPPAQTPPNKPIRLPSIEEVFGFLVKRWKALLIVGLALFVFSAFRGCIPNPFGKSKDTLRAELKEERIRGEVLEHERRLAELAGSLALETERDAARVDRVIEQANQDIEDAVEADDFDRLYDAYRRAYGSVWDGLSEDSPDPAPRRAAPVPGARSHST